jgi:hypothetical protein
MVAKGDANDPQAIQGGENVPAFPGEQIVRHARATIAPVG